MRWFHWNYLCLTFCPNWRTVHISCLNCITEGKETHRSRLWMRLFTLKNQFFTKALFFSLKPKEQIFKCIISFLDSLPFPFAHLLSRSVGTFSFHWIALSSSLVKSIARCSAVKEEWWKMRGYYNTSSFRKGSSRDRELWNRTISQNVIILFLIIRNLWKIVFPFILLLIQCLVCLLKPYIIQT